MHEAAASGLESHALAWDLHLSDSIHPSTPLSAVAGASLCSSHPLPHYHRSFLDRRLLSVYAQHLHLSLASNVIDFSTSSSPAADKDIHTHSSVHSPSSQPPLISSPSPHAHIRTYPISTHCDHHACRLSSPTSHRTRYILRRVCSFGCSIAPQTRIQSHFSSDNRRQDKPNKARFGLFIFRRQSTTKTLHCRGSWHWQPRKNVFLCNLIICTLQQRRGL